MKRYALPLAAFALAIAAPAGLLAAETILPGHWEATYTVFGVGKTEKWCVQPKDIAKFMRGPSNHIYTCTYPVSTAEGGVIRFEGECRSRKGRHAFLNGEGAYTPTTLKVKVEIRGGVKLAGIPITVTPSMKAHLLSETCPADAKVFK
jgi:hypothetical protein